MPTPMQEWSAISKTGMILETRIVIDTTVMLRITSKTITQAKRGSLTTLLTGLKSDTREVGILTVKGFIAAVQSKDQISNMALSNVISSGITNKSIL